MDLFISLAGEGRALLMTTHDLAGALVSCDRLYLVNRSVVAAGRPEDLTDPRIWIDAFGFRPGSPLLTTIGVTGADVR